MEFDVFDVNRQSAEMWIPDTSQTNGEYQIYAYIDIQDLDDQYGRTFTSYILDKQGVQTSLGSNAGSSFLLYFLFFEILSVVVSLLNLFKTCRFHMLIPTICSKPEDFTCLFQQFVQNLKISHVYSDYISKPGDLTGSHSLSIYLNRKCYPVNTTRTRATPPPKVYQKSFSSLKIYFGSPLADPK